MKYKYVGALCGAGKTTAAVNYAIQQASKGAIIIIAQLTSNLIGQTFKDLQAAKNKAGWRAAKVAVHRFDTTTHPRAVHAAISKHMTDPDPGQVIIITHAALIGLPYWSVKSGTELIVDEIPTVDGFKEVLLPENRRFIFEALSAEKIPDSLDYLRVTALDDGLLENYLEKDDINDVVRELAVWALHPDRYDFFVLANQWEGGKEGRFCFFSMLLPELLEPFETVTFLGAHFEESLLCQIWTGLGVEFVENAHLARELRFAIHDLGSRKLKISYLTEESWSKHRRNRVSAADFAALIEAEFAGHDYGWIANNDHELPLKGRKVGNACHGNNSYMGLHRMAHLSALNPTPAHQAFLESRYRVDGSELKRARMCESAYQGIMRCSLRDPKATADVELIVADRVTADFLASQFSGYVKVVKLNHDLTVLDEANKCAGRPTQMVKLPASEHRAMERQKSVDFKKWSAQFTAIKEDSGLADKLPYIHNLSAISFSLWTSIRSTSYVHGSFPTWDEFIKQMRLESQRSYANKQDNFLISPASFAAVANTSTLRGLVNVTKCWGLWLDVDGGHLTPSMVERALSDLRVVTWNSWSGNGRFRVLIPTDKPMNAELYHYTWDTIVARIEKFTGMTGNKLVKKLKYTGIDRSKRPACSIFYLPSQACDPKDSFFQERPGELLNVDKLVDCLTLPRETVDARKHVNPQSPEMAKLRASLIAEDAKNSQQAVSTINPTIAIWNSDVVPAASKAQYDGLRSGRYEGLYKLLCAIAGNCKRRGIYLTAHDLAGLAQAAHAGNPGKARKGWGFNQFLAEAKNAL